MTATKLGQFHFEANEYDFKVCTKKNVTFNFIDQTSLSILFIFFLLAVQKIKKRLDMYFFFSSLNVLYLLNNSNCYSNLPFAEGFLSREASTRVGI
jgi:hypothetical protein